MVKRGDLFNCKLICSTQIPTILVFELIIKGVPVCWCGKTTRPSCSQTGSDLTTEEFSASTTNHRHAPKKVGIVNVCVCVCWCLGPVLLLSCC